MFTVPAPEVIIIQPNGTHYVKTSIVLMCNITLINEVDTETSVTVMWCRNGTVVRDNRITPSRVSESGHKFFSTLTFSPLQESDNNTNFTCSATAMPHQNHQDFVFPSDKSSNFLILTVRIRGQYLICNAQDIMLCSSFRCTAPTSPFSLNASPTSNSVMLTWTQQNDDVVDKYSLTAVYFGPCPNNSSQVVHHHINGSRRSFNLTGLQEFSNYLFNLVAMNSVGINSTSIKISTTSAGAQINIMVILIVKLSFTVAPGPPPSFSVPNVTLTTVTIAWSHLQCIEQNGAIRFYRVEYGHESITESMVVQSDTTTFTANGLEPKTTYVFQVRAVNENNSSGLPNGSNITTSSPDGKCFIL